LRRWLFAASATVFEDRALEMLGAAFAGSDAADHVCAVLDHLLGVEGAFAAGEALTSRRVFSLTKMLIK